MNKVPATPYQLPFWRAFLRDPQDYRYNAPIAFDIRGTLDVDALEKALVTYATKCHEACQTYFVEEADGLYQVKDENIPIVLEKYDAADYPGGKDQFIQDFSQYPFDLTTAPLFKFGLLRLNEQHHAFILNFQHTLADSFSAHFTVQCVSDFYNHYAHGQVLPNPYYESKREEYQQKLAQTETNPESLYFWQKLLDSADIYTSLPFKRLHQAKQQEGYSHYFDFETAAIKKLASELHSTPSIIITSICARLLGHYCQLDKLMISYPVDIRNEETATVLGPIFNNLPLLCEWEATDSFASLIARVGAQRRLNKTHQTVPTIEMLQNQDSDCNIHILATHLGNFVFDFIGVEVDAIMIHKRRPTNEFMLYYEVSEERIYFRQEYLIADFSEEFIKSFSQHLTKLLRAACDEPEQHLGTFLDNGLTVAAPIHGIDAKVSSNIIDLFHTSANNNPEHTALVVAERRLSYKELAQKVQQRARVITAAINSKASVVALHLERGVDLIINLLATLEAGASFILIPTHLPKARVCLLLKQSAAVAVISPDTADDYAIPVIPLNETVPDTSLPRIQLSQQAYIIATSGSSGQPKLISLSHHNLANVIRDFCQRLALDAEDYWLSATDISFDIFLLEIFAPLCAGATVEFAEDTNSDTIAQKLQTDDISIFQTTPSHWQLLLQKINTKLTKLTAICGGEILWPELAADLANSTARLLHVYGPSETCIWATCQDYKSDGTIHLGAPIMNTQLKIVDANGQACKLGQVGELWLAGAGVALGYLDSKQTEQAFVTDEHGKQWYRTGDRVCMVAPNQIRFIGREDLQVKIRGHRIELAEIEACLLTMGGMKQAAVISEGDSLLAFASGYGLEKAAVFKHLSENLPQYMLPSELTLLDALPLTAAGKIDRRKLQHRSKLGTLVSDNSYIPYDLLELKIKQLWESVLKTQALSIDEDFFHCGGHSILGIHLVEKLEKKFNIKLNASWLYQHPTILQQAQFIRGKSKPTYQPIIKFNDVSGQPPLVLIHPALTGAEVYAKFASLLDKSIPLYAIDSYNLNSGQPYLKSIDVMAARYVAYLKQVQPSGPYYLGGWSLGGIIAYEMAQLLRLMGDEVRQVYLMDVYTLNKLIISSVEQSISMQLLQKELTDRRGKYLGRLPANYLNWVLLCLKNDMQILRKYRYYPYAGPVTLFKTTRLIPSAPRLKKQPFNGWEKHAVNIRAVPINCHHYNLLEGDQVDVMANYIRDDMLSN